MHHKSGVIVLLLLASTPTSRTTVTIATLRGSTCQQPATDTTKPSKPVLNKSLVVKRKQTQDTATRLPPDPAQEWINDRVKASSVAPQEPTVTPPPGEDGITIIDWLISVFQP